MPSTDQFDLNAILANLYRVGPTEEERKRAATQAMARMGLGILAANQPSPMPRNPLGVLGQGGLAGMDAYQADLQRQMQERRQGAAGALAGLQIQKQMQQQEALKGLLSASTPAPLPQQALTEGAAQGDIGPTVTNAARLEAMQSSPTPQTYQPVPLDKLRAAAAGGVNIDPFLKLNEAARPDVMQVDIGDKIRLIDKRTLRVIGETPKGSAPGATPFEAKDLPPSGYRDFLLQKGQAGASKQITNVNAFTPASEEAQKEFMRASRVNYERLRDAPVQLANIDKAKALIGPSSPFVGSFGDTKRSIVQFFNNNLGTNISEQEVANSGELRTRVFQNIMDNLKKMDAQPSQLQQKIMMDALGNLNEDPKALGQMLDAYADVIRGKVVEHNREVSGARGVIFPYDPLIKLPTSGGGDKKPEVMNSLPPANQHRGRVIEDSEGKRFRSDGMTWRPL